MRFGNINYVKEIFSHGIFMFLVLNENLSGRNAVGSYTTCVNVLV